jgi:hypothetical protein
MNRGERQPSEWRAPALPLMLAEVRGILEFNASLLLSPLLMRAPRGDGHPVLALPGFLASDLSMAPLRRYLGELGYDTHAWQMGRNTGGVARLRPAARSPSSAGAWAASMPVTSRFSCPTSCGMW